MNPKQVKYFYSNNVLQHDIQEYKINYFINNILNNLENIENYSKSSFNLYTNLINNSNNKEFLTNNYNTLRSIYGLKPIRQVPIKSFTTSILLQILKDMDTTPTYKRKYYVNKKKITTIGCYNVILSI
jgi:hypothetical protein